MCIAYRSKGQRQAKVQSLVVGVVYQHSLVCFPQTFLSEVLGSAQLPTDMATCGSDVPVVTAGWTALP